MTDTTTVETTADGTSSVMLTSGGGWEAEAGRLALVPNWYPPELVERPMLLVSDQLLGLAPYPEPLSVADTGSTSEMNRVVVETAVLVATTGVTVKVKGAVEWIEAADPFPGVPVSMSGKVDV